jgi:hypothetical protein
MQRSQYNTARSYYGLIAVFVALKIGFSIAAGGNYGFHRDELLHLTLGDHLDWGYMEVPPMIALLAKISTMLFGSSVFAARIFAMIASAAMIWVTGLLTVELGGRCFAITIACLCMIFSPGMAASGYLLQPVVFDQLWWLLAAYLTAKYLNKANAKYLYWLAIVTGLGLLTKYTMAFFVGALLIGVILSPQHKLLWRRETVLAVMIAIVIFMPNIWWQYSHNWPIVKHMTELKHQQLDHVKPADFIVPQFLIHGAAIVVWLVGSGFLLFSKQMRSFRALGFAYLLVFAFLLKMSGKAYYLLAGYPMLFAAGGAGMAYWFKGYLSRSLIALLCIVPNLILLPLILPVLNIDRTLSLFGYFRTHVPALDFAVTWEDQKKHPLTQDYADMFGWEEMAQKCSEAFHKLTPEQQKQTVLFTDNYGEAGALHVLAKKYDLPPVISLSSSFALWAPPVLNARFMIYVSDDDDVSDLGPFVGSYQRTGSVTHRLAREHGTAIFLIKDIKPGLRSVYQAHRRRARLE